MKVIGGVTSSCIMYACTTFYPESFVENSDHV